MNPELAIAAERMVSLVITLRTLEQVRQYQELPSRAKVRNCGSFSIIKMNLSVM